MYIREMKSVYYVYVLFRENGVPFYVGMGKGDRWLAHEKRAVFRQTHKDRVISLTVAAIGELPKVKVHEGLLRADALAAEIALIAAIGREPYGPLINQTRGGDGVFDLPEETKRLMRAKISAKTKGRKQSPDHTAKIRAAHIAMRKVIAPEQRLAISLALSGRKRPDLSAARKGKPLSEEAKAKLRARTVTDEARAKISAALTGRPCSPETAAKISAAQLGTKRSADQRAKMALIAGGNTRGKIWITDGRQGRRVLPDAPIPDGWTLGRAPNLGFGRSARGRRWITDGRVSRFCDADGVPDGWRLGRALSKNVA